MRRTFFVVLLLSAILGANAQNGWRKGEMEVKITLTSQSMAEKLHSLNVNAEQSGPVEVTAYVTPSELQKLEAEGFSCRITVPDLNSRFITADGSQLVPPGYQTYEQIVTLADSLAQNFPAICKKVIFGTSLGGKQLGALKISDNVDVDEPEASILFDGGIHGDEVMGPELVIRYARALCLGYGTNPDFTDLINHREIWLYYMVNPDGRINMSRYNNNGVDCNRDAGYMWNAEGSSPGAFSQVESRSLRDCMLQVNPVVYTNYHAGDEIISYPWSYRTQPAPDNDHMNRLARTYSDSSGYNNLPYGQGYNIMYPINGSNKDFQYGVIGNVGWSIEITLDKQPPSSQIIPYYNKNAPAMTTIIRHCGYGAEGIVTDSITGEPILAQIWIDDFYPVMTSRGVGDYHKYLTQGVYTLKVTASGYVTKVIPGITVPAKGSVTTNVKMVRETGRYAAQPLSCRIPLTTFGGFTNQAFTPGITAAPDSIYYSLWKSGWMILDMGDTIFNGTGNDFRVREKGTDPEGFSCYAGTTKDGPWQLIGTGMGTTEFDLGAATAGVISMTRYLKLVDDGDGPSAGSDLGFDLDAVEMITMPLIADFTVSDNTPCNGSAVSFTDYTSGSPATWLWEFPGGVPSSSADQNPQGIVYPVPGTYPVTLTVTNTYCNSKKTRNAFIIAGSLPVVDLGNDTILLPGDNITLHAGNPGCTYVWSTGETTEAIVADSTGYGLGDAVYWVNVQDAAGCAGSDTILITFSWPQGNGDIQSGKIRVYPNPAREVLNIEADGANSALIRLISSSGQVLFEKRSSFTKEIIDLKNFTKGIYLLEIQSGGKTETRKILIH